MTSPSPLLQEGGVQIIPSCRRGANHTFLQERHNKSFPSYRRSQQIVLFLQEHHNKSSPSFRRGEGRSYTCEPFRVYFYFIAKKMHCASLNHAEYPNCLYSSAKIRYCAATKEIKIRKNFINDVTFCRSDLLYK